MNIRKLSINVDAIEVSLEKFKDRELTYRATRGTLIELGYSKSEAKSILDNITGTPKNGLNR